MEGMIEYIAENMIVVYTKYTVNYDNTKVPYQEGTLAQYSILIRDDKNSPWRIWDSCGTADYIPAVTRAISTINR